MTEKAKVSEDAKALQELCEEVLSGNATVVDFQSGVRNFELSLTSIQQNSLRDFIIEMEGELELIRFTIEDAEQLCAIHKIAEEILTRLQKTTGFNT